MTDAIRLNIVVGRKVLTVQLMKANNEFGGALPSIRWIDSGAPGFENQSRYFVAGGKNL